MRYNGVIQTWLKDSVMHHLELHLSAAVANFNGRHFITSSSWSANTASHPLKYLEAFKPHWHFHCNTFAIINRANFFLLWLIMEWKIALLSQTLNWVSWMHQLRLPSGTAERSTWSWYKLAGEQLWNGLIWVISNEQQCESDTYFLRGAYLSNCQNPLKSFNATQLAKPNSGSKMQSCVCTQVQF